MSSSSSSTVGAQQVDKKDFSCIISKIMCRYYDVNEKTGEKKEHKVTLFERSNRQQSSASTSNINRDSSAHGILSGRITNQKDIELYFITNHHGREMEVRCRRFKNSCTDSKHEEYIRDYIDPKTKELKRETKKLDDGKFKLFYYDLFYRASERAGNQSNLIKKGGAYVAGDTMDFIMSLRFLFLPIISLGDVNYAWHTSLTYRECPSRNNVPMVTFNTYPDIEFSMEIGFKGIKKEANIDKRVNHERIKIDKVTKTPFSFKFSVSYAHTTHELEYEKVNEQELDPESRKGFTVYKSIKTVANFLEDASQFTDMLKDAFDPNSKVGKDLGIVSKGFGIASKGVRECISGSFEVSPSIEGKWHYAVSDDLTRVGRHVEFDLSIECTGTVTIDLFKLGLIIAGKSVTAGAVTVSVGTGGLAAPIAFLVNWLATVVVNWLKEKIEDGIIFKLIFTGNANAKSPKLTWDTSKEKIFNASGFKLEIKPEIKLLLSAEFKTSITWNLFIVKVNTKTEVSAKAEVATSLTYGLDLNIKQGYLGIDQELKINPFRLELGCKAAGSFELERSSKTVEDGSKDDKKFKNTTSDSSTVSRAKSVDASYVKECKPIEVPIERKNWIKLYDVVQGGGITWEGKFGGGGGGNSW